MTQDPFIKFKEAQREGWSLFGPVETLTTPPAAQLVNFVGIQTGHNVLDVGCGTGVVAVTAARRGAKVSGLDLSPALLERAKWNAKTAKVEVDFKEGDAENLPYSDSEFDVVVSQFGHMFAPRPEVAISEMLRVLKPGGRIAFSTWPPELFTGRMFALVGKHVPAPEGAAPPPLWGDIKTIRERLGSKVKEIQFERDLMHSPALSPQHLRTFMESNVGPLIKVNQIYKDNPNELKSFREEFETLISEFMRDNILRQHYLMTRALKV